MSATLKIYYGNLTNKNSLEGSIEENSLYLSTEDWTIWKHTATVWEDITATSDEGLFFLAPTGVNGVRNLFLVEEPNDLPPTYQQYDFLVANADVEAEAPTYGEYTKTYKAYTLYTALGQSIAQFENEEWAEVDRLFDNPSSRRFQTLRHDIQDNFETGDVFVPEADILYTGTYDNFTFRQDTLYFATSDFLTPFNPGDWARLLKTNNEVEDSSAFQRIQVLNSGDTLTPSEKLDWVQEWENYDRSAGELEVEAQSYLSNFPYLQTSLNDFKDARDELYFLFYGSTGILNDLSSSIVRVGLWSTIENTVAEFSLRRQLFQEDLERAKTQYEDLTGYDNEDIDGTSVTSSPNEVTGLYVVPGINSIFVGWDAQENLTNFRGYNIQASEDEIDWYSLDINEDGYTINDANIMWRGLAGSRTFTRNNTIELEGIKGYSANFNIPQSGRTIYFRVQVVTRLGSTGPYGTITGKSEIPRINTISAGSQRSLAISGRFKAVDVEEIDGIPTYALNRDVWSDTFENFAKSFDDQDLVMYRVEDILDDQGNIIASQYVEDLSTNGKVLGRWSQVSGNFPQHYESIQDGSARSGGFFLRVGDNSGNDSSGLVWSQSIPFDPSKMYRIRARVRRTAGTNNAFSIGVIGRNQDNTAWVNLNGDDLVSDPYPIAAFNELPTVGAWNEFIGYIGAHYITQPDGSATFEDGYSSSPSGGSKTDPNDPGKFQPTVRYFRPIVQFNRTNESGTTDIDFIQIEEIDPSVLQRVNLWSYGPRPFSIDGDKVSGVMTSQFNPEFNFWDLETGEFKVGISSTAFFHVNPIGNFINIQGLDISLTSSDLKTFFDPDLTGFNRKEFAHAAGGLYWGLLGQTTPVNALGYLEWDVANDTIALSAPSGTEGTTVHQGSLSFLTGNQLRLEVDHTGRSTFYSEVFMSDDVRFVANGANLYLNENNITGYTTLFPMGFDRGTHFQNNRQIVFSNISQQQIAGHMNLSNQVFSWNGSLRVGQELSFGYDTEFAGEFSIPDKLFSWKHRMDVDSTIRADSLLVGTSEINLLDIISIYYMSDGNPVSVEERNEPLIYFDSLGTDYSTNWTLESGLTIIGDTVTMTEESGYTSYSVITDEENNRVTDDESNEVRGKTTHGN